MRKIFFFFVFSLNSFAMNSDWNALDEIENSVATVFGNMFDKNSLCNIYFSTYHEHENEWIQARDYDKKLELKNKLKFIFNILEKHKNRLTIDKSKEAIVSINTIVKLCKDKKITNLLMNDLIIDNSTPINRSLDKLEKYKKLLEDFYSQSKSVTFYSNKNENIELYDLAYFIYPYKKLVNKKYVQFSERNVVNNSDLSKYYNGVKPQDKYGKNQQKSIVLAALAIRKDRHFFETLEFLGFRRSIIAHKLHHLNSHVYGLWRNSTNNYYLTGSTCLGGLYKQIADDFSSKFNERRNNSSCDFSITQYSSGKTYNLSYAHEDEKIKLSEFCFWFNEDGKYCYNSCSVFHPSSSSAEKVLYIVSKKFYNIKNKKNISDEDLVKECAEIFWLLCQAKPFVLGDPSIAEAFIKALLLDKGLILPAWKKGIIPWVETMLAFSPEEFADGFLSLFESEGKLEKINLEDFFMKADNNMQRTAGC